MTHRRTTKRTLLLALAQCARVSELCIYAAAQSNRNTNAVDDAKQQRRRRLLWITCFAASAAANSCNANDCTMITSTRDILQPFRRLLHHRPSTTATKTHQRPHHHHQRSSLSMWTATVTLITVLRIFEVNAQQIQRHNVFLSLYLSVVSLIPSVSYCSFRVASVD